MYANKQVRAGRGVAGQLRAGIVGARRASMHRNAPLLRRDTYGTARYTALSPSSHLLPLSPSAQDLRDAMAVEELTQSLQLHSIRNHDWHIQACCALTGDGLLDGINWIYQRTKGNAS